MKSTRRPSALLFLKQVRQEIDKIVWPARKEVVAMTIFVFIMIFLFSIFFLAVDSVIASLLKWVLGWQTL